MKAARGYHTDHENVTCPGDQPMETARVLVACVSCPTPRSSALAVYLKAPARVAVLFIPAV
jgi:hypothetical protein